MSELRKVERVESSHPALQVSRQLLDHLLTSGNVAVGDRLPSERELAKTFDVARSTVRDALKWLSLLGLLEIRLGDGTYFSKGSSSILPQVIQWGMLLDEPKVENLLDARRVVEVGLAELAAVRRDAEDVEELASCIGLLKLAMNDPEIWVDRDVAFHLRVAQSAHSGVLSDVLYRLRSLLGVTMSHNQAQVGDNVAKFSEHERIFVAIRDQDPQEAAAAMRDHLDKVGARLHLEAEPLPGDAKGRPTEEQSPKSRPGRSRRPGR